MAPGGEAEWHRPHGIGRHSHLTGAIRPALPHTVRMAKSIASSPGVVRQGRLSGDSATPCGGGTRWPPPGRRKPGMSEDGGGIRMRIVVVDPDRMTSKLLNFVLT